MACSYGMLTRNHTTIKRTKRNNNNKCFTWRKTEKENMKNVLNFHIFPGYYKNEKEGNKNLKQKK